MRTKGILFLLLAVLVAAPAAAGDKGDSVTLEGVIACAKCTLEVEGAKKCQSVLVVKDDGAEKSTYYYLVTNDVTEEAGHVCQGEKPAVITGTVTKKDGKMWLTATAIEAA